MTYIYFEKGIEGVCEMIKNNSHLKIAVRPHRRDGYVKDKILIPLNALLQNI